jgi:hypothetical protein
MVFQIFRERFQSAPVGCKGTELTGDEALHKGLAGLLILTVHAVVADVGVSHHDDLSGIGWIGENLLVPGKRGIENHLAAEFPLGTKGAACEGAAVFECQ